MMLKRETVYDLENTYDEIADADEELVDKHFAKLQPLLDNIKRQHNYKQDDIDDKLVSLFLEAAAHEQIDAKWAKGYLFYTYFDEE